MKAGQICRVKCGRFTGVEVRIVEKIPRNGLFSTVWADRLRNYVNVSGTINFTNEAGSMEERNFQASLHLSYLVKLDKKSASVYNAKKGISLAQFTTQQVWGEIDKLLET